MLSSIKPSSPRQSRSARRDATYCYHRFQSAVGLHAKSVDCSVSIRKVEKKTAVPTLSHINGMAAISDDARPSVRAYRLQAPVVTDAKTGDRAASRIGCVDETSIMRSCQPTRGGLFGWNSAVEDLQIGAPRN